MTRLETASLIASYTGLVLTAVQCVLIWYGLRIMQRAGSAVRYRR